jgi:hypothetical protein
VLTPADEAAILTLAGTKSLRSLAAAFGVSHETVRAVLRAAGRPRRDLATGPRPGGSDDQAQR